ncbi:hypothetical protein DL98DRAFT_507114 [Cadophora sp. DSE1049]|nr:hypothetical protein DL98DRAFT_507114 [Cadophora sp. DSE1049]
MMSTITDVLSKDHRELVHYYKKVLNAPDTNTATCWQNQFVRALARHLVAEELVVYPAFEKVLGDRGRIIADKDKSEHQAIKQKLQIFQGLKAGTMDFVPSLESLVNDLAEHLNEEEMVDLPALDGALSSEESKSLATSFCRIKAFLPSRSHPPAPIKPPLGTIASFIAAPFDHLGDLLRRFPDERVEPSAR